MKSKIYSTLLLFVLISILLPLSRQTGPISSFLVFSRVTGGAPQSTKTLKDDYMDKILSRGTDPLGLKEDLFLKKLLEQPDIKWAIRSGYKNILQ